MASSASTEQNLYRRQRQFLGQLGILDGFRLV
jgi:hypothetical protein